MADLLGRVNASIDSVKAVVAQASAAGVDPALVDAWKDDFDALKLKPGPVEARIGFIGRTGAGKSQALNAILGERRLFPVAGSKSCTATVIEAKYHSAANYRAVVQFITMRQWGTMVDELISGIFPNPRQRSKQNGSNLNGDTRNDARKTVKDILQALLGEPVTNDQISRKEDVTRLFNQATNRHESLLNGESLPTIIEDNKNDFYNAVCPYVTGGDNGVESLWPLVSVCSMYHNWELLKDGIILVDLPGTGDANNVRGKVANRYLQECHALFVVADSVRFISDKGARDLGLSLQKELMRQLQLDGRLNMVSFMPTKIDQYQADELLGESEYGRLMLMEYQEMGERLSELEEAKDQLAHFTVEDMEEMKTIEEEMHAIEMTCLRSRIERTKVSVREIFNSQINQERNGRMDSSPDVGVFCISAERALNLQDRNAIPWKIEDTGIPQLRSHLQAFAMDQINKLARRNLGLVYRHVALLANAMTAMIGPDVKDKRSNITNAVLESVKRLAEKEIVKWSDELSDKISKPQLQGPLGKAAGVAQKNANEVQLQWSNLQYETYLHAMRERGEFHSINYYYVDMNRALADPILNAMKGMVVIYDTLMLSLRHALSKRIESSLSEWEAHGLKEESEDDDEEEEAEDDDEEEEESEDDDEEEEAEDDDEEEEESEDDDEEEEAEDDDEEEEESDDDEEEEESEDDDEEEEAEDDDEEEEAEDDDEEEEEYIRGIMRQYAAISVPQCIEDNIQTWTSNIKNHQMLLEQKVVSSIKSSLSNAYAQAAEVDNAIRTTDRMHKIMMKGLRRKEKRMFKQAIELVTGELYELVDEIRTDAEEALEKLYDRIQKEFLVVIDCGHKPKLSEIATLLYQMSKSILDLGSDCGLDHDTCSERCLEDAMMRFGLQVDLDIVSNTVERLRLEDD